MNFIRSTLAVALILPAATFAQETTNQRFYVKPTLAFSLLSDQTSNTLGVGALDGSADIKLESGFASGLNLGFNLNENWSSEIGWEYRSNDSEVTPADGQRFPDGNFASNIFFVNGLYNIDSNSSWKPYVGGGLNWTQEIDIDLEIAGNELSYSGGGDLGFQLFAGIGFRIDDRWSVLGEVRYSSITGVDLSGEGIVGSFQNLDYSPISLQMGLKFAF